MRYDVKKFIFIGLSGDKVNFFKSAQEAGIIHFIDLDPSKIKEAPEKLQDTLKAIKVLRGLPPAAQEDMEDYTLADPIVDNILHLKHTLEKLEEEDRVTRLEIARIEIFGNFSPADIEYIRNEGHREIQFFCAREGFVNKAPLPEEVIYVGSEHGLDYFVAINTALKTYEGMIEMKIDRPLKELKKRLIAIKKEHRLAEEELKKYSKYNEYLHYVVVHKLNTYHLENAQNTVKDELGGALFVASGYVPINKVGYLSSIAKEMAVQMDEVAIEDKDQVPTFLENHGVSRLGQDLIRIYDTPSTTDNDPSVWVLFWFALFFAFIVGDGGYGAVFLGFALYLRYKHPNLKGTKRRVLNLVIFLCIACIIWGITISSFFGISLSPENPFRKFSLVHYLVVKKAEYHIQANDQEHQDWIKEIPQLKGVTDPEEFLKEGYVIKDGKKSYEVLSSYSDAILLELALFIGVVHLSLGLLRYARRNWAAIGWVCFLIGSYLYFPYYLEQPSMLNYAFGVPFERGAQAGLHLIEIGIPLAVVLAVWKHGWLGLTEATAVMQIFADTLSYLRLYALGLAGAIMASTINDMAATVPIVFAVILIVCSHLVNMLMCVGSGLIHGLRLNFLEWYRYCFEGGGKPFKPLELLKRE